MSEDSRTKILTKHLKAYDPKLYAIRDDHSKAIHVMREGTRLFGPIEYEGIKFMYPVSSPHYILALTDNWSKNGTPVDWGIEPLMHRIAEIDSWNRHRQMDELIASYEKRDAAKEKDRLNMHESWLKDNRSIFKKAFSDINTSSLDVKEKERKLYGNL